MSTASFSARAESTGSAPWLSDDDVPILLLFLVFGALALIMPAQSDTFYHLRSGQAMWEMRGLLDRELFSHTAQGQPLQNHWWLSQLLFYGLYAAGGPAVLTLGLALCAMVALVMSWKLTRGSMELRFVSLCALLLVVPQWSLRPQVFSMLLMMLVIRLVLSNRLLLVVPVLLIWANAHAMVVFGVAIAGVVAFEACVWSRHRLGRSLAVAVCAAAAPMASPLGYHYWPRVLDTVRDSRLLVIDEYRSLPAVGLEMPGLWLLIVVLLVVSVRALPTLAQRDAGDRILLLTSAGLAVATLLSVRNGSFFAMVAVPTVSRLLAGTGTRPSRPAPRAGLMLLAAASLGACTLVLVKWQSGGIALGWKQMTPQAIAAVRSCPSPVYNEFGDGGTLMWFVPEQPVFVDGRVEAYPAPFLHRVRRADVLGDYQALFAEYNVQCAVLRTGSRLAVALSADHSMAQGFADASWTVFVRTRTS